MKVPKLKKCPAATANRSTGGRFPCFFPENNGNGSLMRILPLVFFLKDETDIKKRYIAIKEVSSITHAHFRAVFSCFIFVEYGIQLLLTDAKNLALKRTVELVKEFSNIMNFNSEEMMLFDRVLSLKIGKLKILRRLWP